MSPPCEESHASPQAPLLPILTPLLGPPLSPHPLSDNFGVTPLLEALRGGHLNIAALLRARGAEVLIGDPSSELCQAVKRAQAEYLEVRLSDWLSAQ